jgi:hypothetical protein
MMEAGHDHYQAMHGTPQRLRSPGKAIGHFVILTDDANGTPTKAASPLEELKRQPHRGHALASIAMLVRPDH